jgi:hypothetical protein
VIVFNSRDSENCGLPLGLGRLAIFSAKEIRFSHLTGELGHLLGAKVVDKTPFSRFIDVELQMCITELLSFRLQ